MYTPPLTYAATTSDVHDVGGNPRENIHSPRDDITVIISPAPDITAKIC